MFSSAVPYKNQHYAELKKDCIKDKRLFEDPEFPASSESLYFRKPPPGFVEWKRPGVSGSGGSGGPLLLVIFAANEESCFDVWGGFNDNINISTVGDM